MSGIHSAGFSNNLIYDNCNYQQYLNEINNQYQYRLYQGAYENIHKCIFDKFYHPYDLVDVESELRNETRPASNCNMYKYNPNNNTNNCQSIKEPYNISSIQDNIIHPQINNLPKNTELEKNKSLMDNIKSTIGYNKENFTTEEVYQTFFNKDPNLKFYNNNNNNIVENTKCKLPLNTFDNSVPKVCNDCCSIVYNNIPKRYCNGIIIPEFIQ